MESHTQVVVWSASGIPQVRRVEVAATPAARARGLAFRQALDPRGGMLFVWPAPAQVTLWMKDTLLHLDMAFIDADGRVCKVVANAAPKSTVPLACVAPVRFALELPVGEAARLGLAPGSRVTFPTLPPAV